MRVVHGDLLELAQRGAFDVIVHGCNCHCNMDLGIALAIRRQFPQAYQADQQTAKGSRLKLGSFSAATVEVNTGPLIVVNAYTQFDWKGPGVKADYPAIRSVMAAIAGAFGQVRLGYPKIGAGLAGGDWSVISAIIDEEFEGLDHTCVELPR